MDCTNNNPGLLLLVTVAMLVIQSSSFVSAKSNGDKLRHIDVASKDVAIRNVTSKDATLSNVDDFVTSFLTSPGAVPDTVRSRSTGDTLHHNDVASKDVNVNNKVTSLLTSLEAIPDNIRRMHRAIPERTQRAILDRHRRVVPDTKRITIPEKHHRAIPDRHRRATKPCTMDCSRVKHRPVCGTDRQTYRHKCELKRIRRCEGRRVRAVPMGFCTGIHSNSSLT